MFDLLRAILFLFIGFPFFFWLLSAVSGWQELAEKYEADRSIPDAFYLESDRQISFRHETKSGGTSLNRLGIGVLEGGLYLTTSSIPLIGDRLFPPLLIPWSDISYRRNSPNSSSSTYFTFYLGNPRITRFSLNAGAIERLEADYGEPIFLKKLGEPS